MFFGRFFFLALCSLAIRDLHFWVAEISVVTGPPLVFKAFTGRRPGLALRLCSCKIGASVNGVSENSIIGVSATLIIHKNGKHQKVFWVFKVDALFVVKATRSFTYPRSLPVFFYWLNSIVEVPST